MSDDYECVLIDAIEDRITLDLQGCARCDGDGHRGLSFTRLHRPLDDFTHWAPCPTNGEPILLRVTVTPPADWKAS